MPKRENPFGWSFADDVLQPKEVDDIEAKKALPCLRSCAPILVAKGQGLFAKKSSVAKAAGAFGGGSGTRRNAFLPAAAARNSGRAMAVATVLSWVYWLKGQRPRYN